MNFFLLSVCFGLIFLIMVLGDGLVVALAKLLIAALVIVAIHFIGRLSNAETELNE